MAQIEPLRALRYDLDMTGGLQPVVAPPYDVIDAAQRRELEARSPYNVVRIDLPQSDGDPYAHAAELLGAWRADGVVVADRAAGDLAAGAGLHRPRWQGAHAPGLPRTRARRGVRRRQDPPARAHPSRATGGPPAADSRHPGQPVPDLLAVLGPRGNRLGGACRRHRRRPVGADDRRRRDRKPALAGRRRTGDRGRPAGGRTGRVADRRRAPSLRDGPGLCRGDRR